MLVGMIRAPDFQDQLKAQGLVSAGASSAHIAAVVARALPTWRDVAKAANIEID